MDPFEERLKSLPLRRPSIGFGKPGTLADALRRFERRQTLLERINNMSWKSKAAAIVGLTASVLMAYLGLTGVSGSSVAFAQVAERFRAAQTLTFDSTTTRLADGTTLSKGRSLYLVPGKVRIEFSGENEQSYVVFDTPGKKVMMVDVKHKTARVSSIEGGENKDMALKAIEDLKSLDEKESRPLDEKLIDGVQAKGFQIDDDRETMSVWVNSANGDPIQVELLQKEFPGGPVSQVWSNIKLDKPLDPTLFSTEPPPGYAVQPFLPVDFNASPAEHVAQFLKIYVKHMDGQLPPELEEATPLLAKKLGPPKPDQPPSEEILQLSFRSAAVHATMRNRKRGVDWQYYASRKLGDADQIVFWSRDRQGDKYQAVFGDLRVEAVAEENLPHENRAAR